MRRLVLLAAVVGFVLWRNKQITEHDRANGFGAFAAVVPVTDP